MPGTADPRASIPEETPDEARRAIPVPHKPEADEAPVDPLAPGGSLFDEDEDAVEPNEPA